MAVASAKVSRRKATRNSSEHDRMIGNDTLGMGDADPVIRVKRDNRKSALRVSGTEDMVPPQRDAVGASCLGRVGV